MEDLKFDTMEVNFELAEKYLKENKETIETIEKLPKAEVYRGFWDSGDFTAETLSTFADKIEENAELFAQLEVLSNPSLSVADVKNYDVKLIVQCARCYSLDQSLSFSINNRLLKLYDDEPLAALGRALRFNPGFLLEMPKSRIPVCLLFTQLCKEAGFDKMYLRCKTGLDRSKTKVPSWDTVGVVAEQSDVDSAVDVFLKSPAKTCKLSRVFVQESVYDHFNKAIAWKCGLKKQSTSESEDGAKPFCSQIHVYEKKAFYVDFTGTVDQINDSQQVILVEAFRTTKELLSLVKKYDPFCMSLWSNDLSQANEIAFETNIPIVWINDYGIFDGSPKVAAACYFRFDDKSTCTDGGIINKLKSNLSLWTKFSIQERIKIAKKALNSIQTNDTEEINVISRLKNDLDSFKSKNSIEIEKGLLCVTIENPRGVTAFKFSPIFYSTDFEMAKLYFILKSLVYGNGLLYYYSSIEEGNVMKKIVKAFEDEKMPLLEEGITYLVSISMYPFDVRVVYTNFGSTIFAN